MGNLCPGPNDDGNDDYWTKAKQEQQTIFEEQEKKPHKDDQWWKAVFAPHEPGVYNEGTEQSLTNAKSGVWHDISRSKQPPAVAAAS
eukprot:CAMPEP_0197413464 /NCGR_PEP_ID=MMETSP1170-20131217/326_1 /TAXON_ID=54406 /ORGANISM="Sarcinochrysis sp, Strain CCMP770" /LENGTH=86 /DNA_ID=CAMNT_0042940045 /DNA_START=76 /DNA_END=336 /DNA_ORIENTATION=+